MLKPWAFQQEGIEFFTDRSGILADECGLGKTLTSIEAVKRTQATSSPGHPHKRGPILVVVLNAAKEQWGATLREQCPGDQVITLGVAGRIPNNETLDQYFFPRRQRVWIITHYEALRYATAQFIKPLWANVIADEVGKRSIETHGLGLQISGNNIAEQSIKHKTAEDGQQGPPGGPP